LSCSKPLQNRRSRGFWWILVYLGFRAPLSIKMLVL
jgi:hypothetical protein